jgi:hypothetical protein
MSRDPAALQLRLLQTVVEVAGERNSTLVMPIPVELLRFFDKFNPGAGQGGGAPEAGAGAEVTPDVNDALENAAGPPAIANPREVPLDIPDVPAIPELSPEEKGEVGTQHHLRESGAQGAAETAHGDDDTP